jgi:hypothetical protein
MDYPATGNVSLGSVTGNIKLYVNEGGVNNLTGIGYNNNSMTFGVNQSVFAIPEMVINQSGNVGIGTTNPIYTLDISGNVRSSDLRIDNGNIHLGQNAGLTSQGANCVAIGYSAGQTTQGTRSIAIGDYAGFSGLGIRSIAIGVNSDGTGGNSIAIGHGASTSTFGNSVAIGAGAIANGNNQIVLGTSNETISIPGSLKLKSTQLIKGFAAGRTGALVGNGSVLFGFNFSSIPFVTATIESTSTTQVFSIILHSISVSGFSFVKTYNNTNATAGGAATAENFSWIAIGT